MCEGTNEEDGVLSTKQGEENAPNRRPSEPRHQGPLLYPVTLQHGSLAGPPRPRTHSSAGLACVSPPRRPSRFFLRAQDKWLPCGQHGASPRAEPKPCPAQFCQQTLPGPCHVQRAVSRGWGGGALEGGGGSKMKRTWPLTRRVYRPAGLLKKTKSTILKRSEMLGRETRSQGQKHLPCGPWDRVPRWRVPTCPRVAWGSGLGVAARSGREGTCPWKGGSPPTHHEGAVSLTRPGVN